MLTQQRLRELFNYDPETGEFTWRKPQRRSNGSLNVLTIGRAGATTNHGYRVLSVDGERIMASRLAWLYMTGEWPQHEVDHENRVRDDNRWCNLRQATSSEQKMNTVIRSDNTSGVKGVGWSKRQGMWHARVKAYGVQYHVGYFADLDEARKARDAKAAEIHGQFAKLNNLSTEQTNA